MTIEQNVATSKAALEYIELGESICSDSDIDVRRFWLAVQVAASDRAGTTTEDWEPPKNPLAPMDDKEAAKFGRRVCMFGKHEGDYWDDVPTDYLYWLAEKKREDIDIIRYYESRRVQAEIGDDE